MEQAIFAAGLFLPLQHYFDQIPGVTKTTCGYTGGVTEDPTYEDVLEGTSGHIEALLVEFDASKVSYPTLVRHFFRMHDPTEERLSAQTEHPMYRSVIFYLTEEQKKIAEAVMRQLKATYPRAMMTDIAPAGAFYQAEDWQQKYARRSGHGQNHVPYQPLADDER